MTGIGRKVAENIKALGFDVYMRDPDKDTWLLYTDGDNIGYLQWSRGEYQVCTVHKPNKVTGTGFRMSARYGDLDEDFLRKGFAIAPTWADNRQRASVIKFKNMDDYRSWDSWQASYAKV